MDTCSATHRLRARLLICELAMNHDQEHRDGDVSWAQDAPLAQVGSRVFNLNLRA